MLFQYYCIDNKGKPQKGVLAATGESAVREALRLQGLHPVWVLRQRHALLGALRGYVTPTVSAKILTAFTLQLSLLISSGLTLLGAIRSLSNTCDSKNLQTVLSSLALKLEEGESFSEALSVYPQIFSPIYVATVKAGEVSGQLASTLASLSSHLQDCYLARQKIEAALVYPILLTLAAGGLIIFLLHFAVPKITTLFIDSQKTLPFATQLLIQISDIINQYGIYFLLAGIIKIILLLFLSKKKQFQQQWHRVLLKIPKLGPLLLIINETRFLRTFGILHHSGVSVCDAMQAANAQVFLIPMHERIDTALTLLLAGQSVSQSLAQTDYFSPITLQLICSGEQSGNLSCLLQKAASFNEQTLQHKLQLFKTLFEPLLILTTGAMVLFIVLAILLPIFDLNSLLS